MKKRIIFRADGDSSTGLGHLYRLFGLVEVLKDSFDFVFVTKASSTFSVIPKSYTTHFIPEHIDFKDEVTWLSQSYNPNDHIIIADGYQFNSTYQKQIKDKGYTLVYIDDLASEHMFADLVINHSPYLIEKHYKKEPYTKLALGTRYALLRPGFLKEAKLERNIKSIDSAFVCFGGADPFNLTYKAVTALLELNRFKKISVVLGGAYKFNEILELKNTHPLKIDLYKNLSENELIKVMKNCNFAIVPASTILFEICCIKMPVLSGFYVENQINLFKGFSHLDAIHGCGDFRTKDKHDFKELIEFSLKEKGVLRQIENQSKLFDGRNGKRLLGLINQFNISLRKATLKDMTMIFDWSNEEVVRQNSYNSEPIKIENHKIWFQNKLNDTRATMLIVMINEKPAGIVRFEDDGEHSTIGITISSQYRGQGLSSEILMLSSKYYFEFNDKPILAYIKEENLASKRAFEKSGYKFFKSKPIKGIHSFIYKLDKPNV